MAYNYQLRRLDEIFKETPLPKRLCPFTDDTLFNSGHGILCVNNHCACRRNSTLKPDFEVAFTKKVKNLVESIAEDRTGCYSYSTDGDRVSRMLNVLIGNRVISDVTHRTRTTPMATGFKGVRGPEQLKLEPSEWFLAQTTSAEFIAGQPGAFLLCESPKVKAIVVENLYVYYTLLDWANFIKAYGIDKNDNGRKFPMRLSEFKGNFHINALYTRLFNVTIKAILEGKTDHYLLLDTVMMGTDFSNTSYESRAHILEVVVSLHHILDILPVLIGEFEKYRD